MSRLIERFDALRLHLLAPCGADDSEPAGLTVEDVREFREQVYAELGVPKALSTDTDLDHSAWHLVATQPEQILGCIRFHVFHPHQASRVATQAVVNSGCLFSAVDQVRCETAVAHYTSQWRRGDQPLVQAGALAVKREKRCSAVASALCLAGNAFIRQIGGTAGLVFASGNSGSVRLYARSGCCALTPEDEPLIDSFHDDRITVMGIDPHGVAPELDGAIRALGHRLSDEFERAGACA